MSHVHSAQDKEKLGTEDTYGSLSEGRASRLLEKDGYNELPSSSKRNFLHIVAEVFKEPMFILLVVCGLAYFLFGDLNEALMLMVFVWLVIGITIYQERKVERALESLRGLSSPRAIVIRGGAQRMIPARELVVGDAVIIQEGDRVPADCAVLSSFNLVVDESLLTGESLPVKKSEWSGQEFSEPGGDGGRFVYSSTLVVQGHGVVRVLFTGTGTQVGKIGLELKAIKPEETVLRKETSRLIKIFFAAGMVVCVALVVLYGLSTGNWFDGFLSGLAVAMSIIPEEFAVVLAVFLALGAWRMSRHNTLTRRLDAIQNLGSATVLCVDKTGTLTKNQMVVRKLLSGGKEFDFFSDSGKSLPAHFHPMLESAVLASQKAPFDPMESAIKDAGKEYLSSDKDLHEWNLLREYPLSKDLLAITHVYSCPHHPHYLAAAKGAPEAIMDLCHVSRSEKNGVMEDVERISSSGLRVIAVAKAVFRGKEIPETQHEFDFEFLGLLALEDPVRPNVYNSLAEAYAAGIRVIMMTGDYSGTARHVASQVGLRNRDKVITGAELKEMSDAELRKAIRETNIFARIVPEQKLRIVSALKANGEVVIMTGDGVNDAPALKAAHIGIAMGARGTEVARESAALVLLDDDFSSIIKAVRLGRRIFDNIKKAMTYIISIHVPIAGLAILPVILGWPMIFFPAHIAFLELIIDPVCSVVFEAEPGEKDIMKRKPRKLREPLFDRRTLGFGIIQGIIVLAMSFVVFWAAMASGQSAGSARALSFSMLVIANLFVVYSMRSQKNTIIEMFSVPNNSLIAITFFALAILAVALYVPFMQDLFRFEAIHANDLLLCFFGGLATVIIFEAMKYLKRKS